MNINANKVSERIKQLMEQCGMSENTSVYTAFMQLANEFSQDCFILKDDFPDTKNMRWLLAETRPEIGWPVQAMDALVDITKVCDWIEKNKALTADNAKRGE